MKGGDLTVIKKAGIPNITGTVSDVVSTSGGLHSSGAFGVQNKGRGGGDSSWYYGTINFDAARCSATYGASDTIQPPALSFIPQMKY